MSQFTTSFPNFLDKQIKEVFENYSKEQVKAAAYNSIFRVVDTDEYVESFISDEGIDDFVKLSESAALKEANLGEGYKVSIESEEYGLGLTVTHKMVLRAKDDTVKLAKLIAPKNQKLMIAANTKIERLAHAILNNAFSSDASPALAPNGLSLINDAHTWKSTAGTFDNDLDGVNLSSSAWDAVQQYGGAFVDANSREMPLIFDTIIVKTGSENARTAKRLFGMGQRLYAATTSNLNIYEGSNVKIIETPYLTAQNRWFAMAGNQENPLYLKFIERPTLHDMVPQKNLDRFYPATFSAEAGIINQPFSIVGSVGA